MNVQVDDQDALYYIWVVPQSHAGRHGNVAEHAKAFAAVPKRVVGPTRQMAAYSRNAARSIRAALLVVVFVSIVVAAVASGMVTVTLKECCTRAADSMCGSDRPACARQSSVYGFLAPRKANSSIFSRRHASAHETLHVIRAMHGREVVWSRERRFGEAC